MKRLAVLAAHLARDEQDFGVARARDPGDPRIERQIPRISPAIEPANELAACHRGFQAEEENRRE